jgi:predicted enzyme related to lactoylglutathione lyase
MTTTPAFALSAIGQISLTVSDLERAKRFYRDALGLRHLFDAPPKMSFFDCAGIRLLIGEPEDGKRQASGSVLYFQVADIQEAHASLAARGVEFIQPPRFIARLPQGELWMAEFRDSEGNLLALQSMKR